jgi:membrane-associated protease RseP (regulator of RpoE activity)
MALCVSILCHEWGHSAMAWFFGIKPHIWDIHYSWKPFMLGVSENVDYAKVALLPGWQGVLISFAGPFMNFTWAVVSFVLLALVYKRVSRWVNLFLYAMHFWSVNDWFNYFTLRNIIPRGDIAHMIQFGFPHIVLLVGGLASSAIFLYMLFGPATKWLF